MLNPQIVLPFRARVLLGASDVPAYARNLARRNAVAHRVIDAVGGKTRPQPPSGPAPLRTAWEERWIDHLPFGCVCLVVPVTGGTPLLRIRLVTELQRAIRELNRGDGIEVSLGASGPLRLNMLRGSTHAGSVAALVQDATVRANGIGIAS